MPEQLAIDGGKPVYSGPWFPIFHGSEEIDQEEKQAILRVLGKKRLFRFVQAGLEDSEAAKLEAAYREFIGRHYALAVNSGTSAVIAAVVGAEAGPGDEVIIPAYTFVATAAAVLSAGAIPVICEVDKSLNMDPVDLERKITPHTKMVIPVHMRGVPARMDEIVEVARRRKLRIVEDVAQANGGTYKGRMLGSMGDTAAFSLQQFKVITAGEGGIVVTDDDHFYHRGLIRHDSAIRFWKGMTMPAFAGENYRLSELSAAVAVAQFGKMGSILSRLRATKSRVVAQVEGTPGIELQDVPDPSGDCSVVLIFFCPTAESAQQFSVALKAEGIPNGTIHDNTIPDRHIYSNWDYVMAKRSASPVGCPWSCSAYKGEVEYSPDMCPQSMDYLGRSVLIGLHQWMTEEHADLIAAGIRKVASVMYG